MSPVTLLLFWPLLSARADTEHNTSITDAVIINGITNPRCIDEIVEMFPCFVLEYLKVEINGNVLEPNIKHLYLAEATYKFVPDESVDMKCRVPEGVFNVELLDFKYHGDIDYTNDRNDIKGIRLILKPRHNNSYVECILHGSQRTLMRVNLLQEQKYVEDFVRVNGLAIRTSDDIVTYNYTGAMPTVSCPGTPFAGEKPFSEHRNGLHSTVCSIGGKNTTVQMFKDIPRNGLHIDGLLDHKIIFQRYYDRYESKRIMFYEYTDEDVIPLNASYGVERSEVEWKINSILNNKTHGRGELNLSECGMKKDRLWEVTFMKEQSETVVLFLYVGACSPQNPGVTLSSSPAVVPLGDCLSTLGAAAIGAVVGAVFCASLLALALGMRRRCTKPPPRPPLALEAQEENTYDYVYSHFPKRWRDRAGAVRGGHRGRGTARTAHSAAS